jgi:hypothetical protein
MNELFIPLDEFTVLLYEGVTVVLDAVVTAETIVPDKFSFFKFSKSGVS